ncbi:MAG TPA: biotin synthase BioB [Deltaproteobacteria bacterium]|nr:biotin synthase BioB [Deltaproteobacteria bacterium]
MRRPEELRLLDEYTEKALSGEGLSCDEGRRLAEMPERLFDDVLAAACRIRRRFKGDEVNLCSIVNAKSGLCAEDCSFCAQSVHHSAPVKTYPMVAPDEIVGAARRAARSGAREFSIVASGTAVEKERDVAVLKDAVARIRESTGLESCASLGTVSAGTLRVLKEAGLHSYHHNLETARSFFPEVCTTHAYDDDVETVRAAKELGLYVCSGGVFGLGESRAQRVELAVTLRDLDVDSVPVNFLNPRPGTPLEGARNLTPRECLRIIALYRFMLPAKDIIVCGGRQVNLRSLQPLIFTAGANGMMIGDYLTTAGSPPEEDLQMVRDMGLRPRN